MQAKIKTDPRMLWRGFSDLITLLSFAAICVSMLMTVGDIILRLASLVMAQIDGVRPRWGVFGVVDLTQLALMTAAPLAIAVAFFNYSHIRIDVLVNLFSAISKQVALLISYVLGAAFTGICFWSAWHEMIGQLDFVTTSATLSIPYTWYWVPLNIGLGLSFVGCSVGVIVTLIQIFSTSQEAKNV